MCDFGGIKTPSYGSYGAIPEEAAATWRPRQRGPWPNCVNVRQAVAPHMAQTADLCTRRFLTGGVTKGLRCGRNIGRPPIINRASYEISATGRPARGLVEITAARYVRHTPHIRAVFFFGHRGQGGRIRRTPRSVGEERRYISDNDQALTPRTTRQPAMGRLLHNASGNTRRSYSAPHGAPRVVRMDGYRSNRRLPAEYRPSTLKIPPMSPIALAVGEW